MHFVKMIGLQADRSLRSRCLTVAISLYEHDRRGRASGDLGSDGCKSAHCAGRRNVSEEVNALISGLGFEIISVTAAAGRRVTDAYSRWGKGIHPASLNYGDCFSYDVAIEYYCPLLSSRRPMRGS